MFLLQSMMLTGNYVYAKRMGGTGADVGNSLILDTDGSTLISGYYSGTADFDPGAGTANLNATGGNDIFIASYDASGNYVFANGIGGTGDDRGFSIASDTSKYIYVTGYFNNTVDFDPGTAVNNLTSLNAQDMFVAKFGAPEINVQGNSLTITDGDLTPDGTDGTDFGSSCMSGTFVSSFTIQNTGNMTLNITSINLVGADSAMFTLSGVPSSVASGSSATFDVLFSAWAGGWGVKNAAIQINSNDFDEGLYDFVLKATVIDTTNPTFTCPVDQNLCEGYSSLYIAPGNLTDNCFGPVTVTYKLSGATTGTGNYDPSNESFNLGTTLVTYIFDDGNGNSDSCQISVTVNPVYDFIENQQICSSSSYLWQSNSYSIAGTYHANYSSKAGCDSNYTLNLSVIQADTYYADLDGDWYGAGQPIYACSQPPNSSVNNTDCNDNNPTIHPGASEIVGDGIDQDCNNQEKCYQDQDGDHYGWGIITSVDCDCADVGEASITGDCNDQQSNIHPGATEIVGDGIDQNCNGQEICYRDLDNDDYGNGITQNSADSDCSDANESNVNTDCDDNDAAIHPGGLELCNGKDDNCDGYIDEAFPLLGLPCDGPDTDLCSNGFWICKADGTGLECSESGSAQVEICNGLDDDCDGQIDEGVQLTFYRDADGDGYGWFNTTTQACSAPFGYVSNSTDCNDAASSIHPNATEIVGDGIDQNCNGQEICYRDLDNDDYGNGITQNSADSDCSDANESNVNTDCDDNDATIHPGGIEICNGKDDDCDGSTDEGLPLTYADADGDGFGFGPPISCGPVNNNLDCNDNAITWTDADNDGYGYNGPWTPCGVSNPGDCNDNNASVHPGATEIPGNGIDEDCNGQEICYRDLDGDHYGNHITINSTDFDCSDNQEASNSSDCNDSNSAIYPGAMEIFNGIDEDCSGQADDGMENFMAGWGNIQSPYTVTVAKNQVTPFIYGQVWKHLVTNIPNNGGVGVLAQLGYGPMNSNPASAPGWTWVTGVFNQDVGNNDEFKATLTPTTPGVFAYAWRFSMNGGYSWLYCDKGGSMPTDPYNINDQGVMTVTDIDADGDGYLSANDCNDNNNAINPGATEVCANGMDDDCDGQTDECFTLNVNKSGDPGVGGMVTSTPAGIDCGSGCTYLFPEGTLVTLNPTTINGTTFAGWTGACSGTGPCIITMSSNKTVHARFTYNVLVTKSGNGIGTVYSTPAGINCGALCSFDYDAGSTINLQAIPNAGSVFLGWTGSGCLGTGNCSLWMNENKTCDALFNCLLPEPANSINGPTLVNPDPNPVTYSIMPIPLATSYEWTLPAGSTGISNSNSIQVIFGSGFTSGTISAKGVNNCGSGAISSLYVSSSSQIEVSITASSNPNCFNDTVLFTASVINGGPDMGYQWFVNDTLQTSSVLNKTRQVLHCPYDGNANDVSGQGLHGNVFNATLTNDRFGHPNSAYAFNGYSSYIDFGNQDTLNPHYSDMTISAWVKKDALSQHSRIYSKGTHGGFQAGYDLMFYGWNSPSRAACIFATSTHEHIAYSNNPVEDLDWHHYVGKISRQGYVCLYVDGAKQNDSVYIGDHSGIDIANGTLNAAVGASYSNNGSPGVNEFFTGAIDEVMVYKKALSQNDIHDLFYYSYAAANVFSYVPKHNDVVKCVVVSDPSCSHNCNDTSNVIQMEVGQPPVITPTATPATITVGASSSLAASSDIIGTTFEWNPGVLIGTPVSVTPVTTTTYTVTGTAAGCTGSASVTVTVNPATKTLQVKVFIEGLYAGGGMMHESNDFNPVNETFPPKWNTGIADTVTVVLYGHTYTNVVAKYSGVYLHTDGTLTIPDISPTLSSSYYITIFHRNSVPVTTAIPRPFVDCMITYDFTTASNQAYSIAGLGLEPQKDLTDGLFGMYTGELNQDT